MVPTVLFWFHIQNKNEKEEQIGTHVRGVRQDKCSFKLTHEKSCVLESLVSAEVSQHALASMIEKQHTQTSFTIHWQTIISSA